MSFDELQRALTGTSAEPELTFRRILTAPPSDVWSALTDPARLARWFGTVEVCPTAVGEPLRVDVGGGEFADGTLRACEEQVRVVVGWSWQGEPESEISATLRPHGSGTALTLVHRLADPHNAVRYGGGWEEQLGALAQVLGGPTPARDLEEHGVRAWRRLQDHAMQLEVTLPASRETVWRALTTVAGLRSWWWTQWADTAVEADVVSGGRYRFETPSVGIAVEGEYLSVDPERELSFTWVWVDADGRSADEACVLTLDDGAGGTVLTVRHTGPWPDREQSDLYRQGWESTLSSLASALVV